MKNSLNQNFNQNKQEVLNWELIQEDFKTKFGKDVFESWLKKMELIETHSDYILMLVPTRFIRDWITSRYLDQILQVVRNYKKDIVRIEFKITDQQIKKDENSFIIDNYNTKENISFIKDSYLQYNRIDPNKRFDNFLTGSSNKLAYEASLKVSENVSHIILFIFMVGLEWEKHIC